MATVAFDLIGTLFSLERLRSELRTLGAPERALELWFSQGLRDYFAYSHAGGYVPLAEVLRAGLPRTLALFGVHVDGERAASVVDLMKDLEPSEGAREACELLEGAGWRIVALTNGSAQTAREMIERSGLAGHFSAIRSCDEIEVSKPGAAVYEMARDESEGELWLVAAHAWDTAGAARAGLRTAWVPSVEGRYLEAYPAPDVIATGLADAARKLLRSG